MKTKSSILIGFIICSILTLALPTATFALSNRPQYDEQGNFVPNPFADNDAARYGGLFGPLPDPDSMDNFVIGLRNPELINPYESISRGLNSRNMGFGADENHFIPINRRQSF